ncbi:MAG: head-tail adaptor protein [Candidatus Fimenecus sp.]
MLGGNVEVRFEIKKTDTINEIGEAVISWNKAEQTTRGFIDYSSGQNELSKYDAKVQESTHVFLCDYGMLPRGLTAENGRLIYKDGIYQILLIDDPMELHKHIEIYLKYVGGGQGV